MAVTQWDRAPYRTDPMPPRSKTFVGRIIIKWLIRTIRITSGNIKCLSAGLAAPLPELINTVRTSCPHGFDIQKRYANEKNFWEFSWKA